MSSSPDPTVSRTTPALLAPVCVAALLAGAVAVQGLAQLPPLSWSLAAVLLALGLLRLQRGAVLRLAALLLLGAGQFALRAEWTLQQRLPREIEGADLELVGRVTGLPERREDATRLELLVESAYQDGRLVALQGRVRLSWYGAAPPPLRPCARWQLPVRLKRPRGASNVGGLDYERHALQRGLNASGYVLTEGAPRELAPGGACIDAWRERIAAAIVACCGDSPVAALLRALTVGDQRGLDDEAWQVLRATGVGHLIAISGFHVSLAALAAAWLARRCWQCWPALLLRWPAVLLEAPPALAAALLYAALAGFGVATLRTLLMLAVVFAARAARRHIPALQSLALALAAILLADPLAILSAGFWLSFGGVALLVYCCSGAPARPWWRELVPVQLAMSLGLLPLTIWFFGQGSLVGPIANLVAVPWISFVVVPLTVAGGLLVLPFATLGNALLRLAALALEPQWLLLVWQAQWPLAQWHVAAAPELALLLAAVGTLWLLAPRGLPLRTAAPLLLLPLLWPSTASPRRGEFTVDVIDVGQGLAVFVRTAQHALLYDAGPRYPSGFDLGETAVVPSVQALGVRRLDAFVISHGDSDHAGGAAAVLRSLRPQHVLAGGGVALPASGRRCRAGAAWTWDDVEFRVLHPPDAALPGNDNDRSCVLLVQSGQGRLLLSGDIGAGVEGSVAAAAGTAPLLLLVPHHGSKSSSSPALLDALQVQGALVSAGYRSRFGHPHASVVARYRERGIALFNTADAGCLRWLLRPDAAPRLLERCREQRRRYWNE